MAEKKLMYERPAIEMLDLEILLCGVVEDQSPVVDPDEKTPGYNPDREES